MRFLWVLLLLTITDGERIVESDNTYVISYTFHFFKKILLILLQGCIGGIYIDGTFHLAKLCYLLDAIKDHVNE